MARLASRAFVAGRDSISIADLERVLEEARVAENPDLALGPLFDAATVTREIFEEKLERIVFDTLVAGAEASARTARSTGSLLTDVVQTVPPGPIDPKTPVRGVADPVAAQGEDLNIVKSFDTANPEAERWARERSSDAITGIDEETRAAITKAVRPIIAGGFSRGETVQRMARRIREHVGLTVRDSNAVDAFRARLLEANPGSLVRAGKLPTLEPGKGRYSIRVRVPAGGLTERQLERAVQKYSDLLLNKRAIRIARTETMRASNQGQLQLWQQNRAAGLLTGNEKKVWIVTPDDDLCPVCRPMAGQKVGLTESFDTGRFGKVKSPPAHPQCRCAIGLALPTPKKTTVQ